MLASSQVADDPLASRLSANGRSPDKQYTPAGQGPLRTGYIGPSLTSLVGGSVRVMLQVVNGLAESEDVYALVNWEPSAEAISILDKRVSVRVCPPNTLSWLRGPLKPLKRRLRHMWMLVHLVRSLHLDCLIVDKTPTIYDACLLRSLRLIRIPVVVRWGTLASERLRNAGFERLRARFLFAGADIVVVPSRMARDDLQHVLGTPPQSIRVIENGIDADSITQASQIHPLTPRKKTMVCVERLGPEKHTLQILQAIAVLRRRDGMREQLQGWRLWIVGDGPERATLEEYVRQEDLADLVVFWGHQANPWRLMAQAQFFVTASRGDGFMLALIEAVILGVPVLYPKYGVGAADYLRELGAGREFSSECEMSLADAIAAEIAEPRRIRRETIEKVRAMFSTARCVDLYRQTVASVCRGKRRVAGPAEPGRTL